MAAQQWTGKNARPAESRDSDNQLAPPFARAGHSSSVRACLRKQEQEQEDGGSARLVSTPPYRLRRGGRESEETDQQLDPSFANDAGREYVSKAAPTLKLGPAPRSPTLAHAPTRPEPLARAPRPPRQSSVAISVHEVKDEKSNHQKTTNAIDATLPKDGGNLNDQKAANAGNSGAAAKKEADTGLEGGFASIGRELDDNAPLWRVYRDDVRSHDQNVTLDEWNKTLDVLLIFAGLFSAVVATLVVATVPLLNPQEDYVAIALYTLARSLDKDTTLSAPKPAGPAETSSLWINGLWFASLFLSLSVAFFAILAKQWLVEYNHRMADPPAHPSGHDAATPTASLAWARRRGYFFDGFDKWHVPALVTQILPLLLHVALFLFLVGLAVYIWTLHRPIARGVIALTALLFGLYIISTLLPIWRDDCPTATPLIRQFGEAALWLVDKAGKLCDLVLPSSSDESSVGDGSRSHLNHMRSWEDKISPDAVKRRSLRWLILVSGSESAIFQVFQSLGALNPDEESDFIHSLKGMTAGMSAFNSLPIAPTAVQVVRAIRSELVLGRGSYSSPMLGLDLTPPMMGALKDSYWPDAKLLWASMNLYGRSPVSATTPDDRQLAEHLSSLRNVVISYLRSRTSTSLYSTALQLLRSTACPQSAGPYLAAIVALEKGINEEDCRRIVRAHAADLPHDLQMRAAGERRPRRASSQLYHLVDGDQTPICDCARTAGIICTALTFNGNGDCENGGWIICECSRYCHCENVAPEWRAIRQLFAQPLGAYSENLLDLDQAADTWKYFGALLLTLLSLGDAAVHVLDYTSDYELGRILKFMLDFEYSKTSIRSEIWLIVLTRALTSRSAPSVANLQWVLAAACVLKGRDVLKGTDLSHSNQAFEEILKSEVDTLLESPGASEFPHSSDYPHFRQRLLEYDPEYESRLNKSFGNAATPSEPGKSVTCPAPKSPPSEEFCSLGSPIIQILLLEEMALDNKDLRIAPKTWALLLPPLDSDSLLKALKSLNPFALATLLAGVCYLRGRGHAETFNGIEQVISLLTSSARQQDEIPLLNAVKALNLPADASVALASLQQLLDSDRLISSDKVVILDWLTQPRWSIHPSNLPPTLDLAAFSTMTTIRDAVDESRPLREILWRHMTTRRLADESDDSIDVTRTRRVIAAAKSLGPLPAGGNNDFAKDAAEKIMAAYTQPASPVHPTASDARTAGSSSST